MIRKIAVALAVTLLVACSAGPTANVTTEADVATNATVVTTTEAHCTFEQKEACAAKCEAAAAACDASEKKECTGSTEDDADEAADA